MFIAGLVILPAEKNPFMSMWLSTVNRIAGTAQTQPMPTIRHYHEPLQAWQALKLILFNPESHTTRR